jgi:membrane-associated phospholipid phosphatase
VRVRTRGSDPRRRRGLDLPLGKIFLWLAVVVILCLISIVWIDRPLALWVHGWDYRIRRDIREFSYLGNRTWVILGGLALFVLFRFALRRRDAAMRCIYVVSSSLAGILVVDPLKILFGRARPHVLLRDGTYAFDFFRLTAEWRSFPSGHASSFMATTCCLAIIYPRYRVPLLAFGVMGSLSRVGGEAHYLSDVIAGGYIGIIIALVLACLFERYGVELEVK